MSSFTVFSILLHNQRIRIEQWSKFAGFDHQKSGPMEPVGGCERTRRTAPPYGPE